MDTLKTYLTFNDVLVKPGYTDFERDEIQLDTRLSRNIRLTAPFVSSPMDTVTEGELAIALAKQGGIGIIHRNLTIEAQATEVRKVKKAGYHAAAAVGSSKGYEKRVAALIEAGADAILIDSAHGYAKKVIEATIYVKKNFNLDVIAGSVATAEAATALIDAGADGLRVGMGPGAICSTRIVSGMGVPQLSALLEIAPIAKKADVPLIADGGIINSGDVVKAIVAGASTVMMGRMFAACEESPGRLFEIAAKDVPASYNSLLNGAKTYTFKEYRGMGSLASMKRGLEVSSEDEFHGKNYSGKDTLIAEGVEGIIPCSGTVEQLVDQFKGGVVSGLFYLGTPSVAEAQADGELIQITQASLIESHPHDLHITNTGGNYH